MVEFFFGNFYYYFLLAMTLLAVVVFIVLQFITPAYGMTFNNRWGVSIRSNWGWVLMESPVFLLMLVIYLSAIITGAPYTVQTFPWVTFSMFIFFELHYLQRSFIFPGLMRGTSKMPLSIIFSGFFFNMMNAYMQGGWLFYVSPERYTLSWFWSPQYIIGTIMFFAGMIIKRTRLQEFIDNESLAHIGSLALEYLIITAIATMKLDVILNNASAILTISLTGLILTTIVLMILPKLWLKTNWLENAMVMFGAWTGSTATGMMLLKIADPELETDAGPNLIAATPLWQISTQNFYLTIAPIFMVTAAGAHNVALITAGMLVVALILGFIIGRK